VGLPFVVDPFVGGVGVRGGLVSGGGHEAQGVDDSFPVTNPLDHD
jgi:hypothetical protein